MLTPSQLRALDTSSHRSVTANAGSGKTLVLVERCIDILVSGKAGVKEVVAITFTDKAASELKRKVSEGIARRLAEASDPALRGKLEDIREQLSAAVVDTIHSFCSRILREYPVEAGVDAAFTVLEPVDQQMMLEAAIRSTFESILQEEGGGQRERLFALLRALGKFNVLTIVNTLALKREQVERWILPGGIYTRSDDETLRAWRSHLSAFVTEEFADPRVMSDMRELVQAAKPNETMRLRQLLHALERAETLDDRLHRFEALLNDMLTQKGEPRKKMFGENARIAAPASRLKGKLKNLAPLLPVVTTDDDGLHVTLLKHSRMLLELYQHAIERYEQAKEERSYLDFEDLQLRTKHLLRNEKVRRKLAQRFKFIMVDEYQDTNKLQYEILLPLVDHLAGRNLFIVGDPKQSIYGFRNADVAVFTETKEHIAAHAGPDSAVVLAESFRLLRDIVAFVNCVFSTLMDPEKGRHEIPYDRLVRGRQNAAPGRVELILRDEPEPGRQGISEGELIARRILKLRDERHEVFDKNEQARNFRFSDCAILIRSRTGLAGLEEALVHHRIPYLVSSGVGYFQTQGIYDFYNYFRFMLNTEDDVALAGILRSPFFNVSDAELFEVSLDRKARSFWNHLAGKRAKNAVVPSLLRAVDILRGHIALASRLPVPDLVNRITDDTSYAGFVAGTPRAEQTFANLEKLKRFARSYERLGFTTLYDFTARLKRLIEQEEREGQAAVDILADAVKVMTIHAAKGLEFPVVFVPGLERTFRPDNEPYLDDALGMAFSIEDDGEETIPITEFLRRQSRARMIAEEKRIFYVACTRARDMLVLSGTRPGKRSTENCLNWLLDALQAGEGGDPDAFTQQTVTEYLRVQGDRYEVAKEKHPLRVHVLTVKNLAPQSQLQASFASPVEEPALMLDPIASQPHGEIFSASKIRTYMTCPAKYYLRYVAGLPAESVRLFSDRPDEEADVEIPADLRGRTFHYIMQHIDGIGADRGNILAGMKRFIHRDSYSIVAEPSVQLEELATSVVRLLESEFWRETATASDARTEFPIMAAFGNDYLTGTLDRMFRDRQGTWHILDYKTDAVDEKTLAEKVRQYEPQIQFYALLVKGYLRVERIRAHLFFSSLCKEVSFAYGADELHKYETELASVITKIHARDFKREGRACDFCPFFPRGCAAVIS